jgi:hypothetical protein
LISFLLRFSKPKLGGMTNNNISPNSNNYSNNLNSNSVLSSGLGQPSYLSTNSNNLNAASITSKNSNAQGFGYKPSLLSASSYQSGSNAGNSGVSYGGTNPVSTSSSAGNNGYLPSAGVAGASRFGRLAQFGVMNSSSNSSASNNINDGGNNNTGSGGIGSSFASALGFGRHKI